MADFVASILAPTVDSAMKNVGALIKRQFIYLCFSNNIHGLETEAEKLDNAIQGMKARVDAATNNVKDIDPEVVFWLRSSDNIKEEAHRILNEARHVETGCLRVATRFTLSRRAVKTVAAMVQQQENYSFINICLPPSAISLGTSVYEFESRKIIEEAIMTALRDKNEKMIGIYGMGGLGKTTMAKRIMNRVLEEHMFDQVAMVVVSQQVEKSKIQLEIGGSLGLDLKDKPLPVRVQILNDKLIGKNKTLLILDDVWESLNLNDLGIPCGDESKGCTILLTSQNSNVLTAMDVKEVFGMEHLSEEDAWFLFKKTAGACVDDIKLNSTAKQVARECKGLPIALAIVGAALKDDKDMHVWMNALKKLRNPTPNNTPDFIAEAYNPVILSYEKLYSEEVKSLLLLCRLFPEDDDISIDQLSCFCMGLRLFEDMGSLEETRFMTWTLIKSLKTRSLLLDGTKEDCVRMHNVVRDVCVFISKHEKDVGGKIELLLDQTIHRWNSNQLEIDDFFFQEMRELNVLCIERSTLTSLPQSLQSLRTLILDSCSDMKTISIVGDLVTLEILICRNCESIEELPPVMKRLNRLKLLELSGCKRLKSIGRGIISSLVGLEELKMLNSFSEWDTDDGKRQNARLKELESLTNLRCLEIEITDSALATQNLQLSSKLDRYVIQIGYSYRYFDFNKRCNKKVALELKQTCLGHWIEMQPLKDTEYLCLTGNGANEVDFKKMQNIWSLTFGECESASYIAFPPVEYLTLYNLDNLQEIWKAPMNSFLNLKELTVDSLPALNQLLSSYVSLFTNLSSIDISDCARLHNLGQLSIVGNDCLSQLEKIKITNCERMEQVFLWSKNNRGATNDHITKILFPKLKKLELDDLPNLITFCQGIEGIEFPQLMEMRIHKCPRMMSITATASLSGMGSNLNISKGTNKVDVDDDDHCFSRFLCQPEKVAFSVKKLITDRNPVCDHKIHASSFNGLLQPSIIGYGGCLSLFTSSMTENLASLKELQIIDCYKIVHVIKDDMEKTVGGSGERNHLFPNLQVLKLSGLHKLKTFCKWESDVEMPSLMSVTIEWCPQMTNFTSGFITAPNWEVLETNINSYHDIFANVSSNLVKKLKLNGIGDPLCHFKFYVSMFNGLKKLSIIWYEGTSLFSSSTAGNLINLTELEIGFCYQILKVIGDEKDEEKDGNLSIFPNLQKLCLSNLRKLVTFWEWKGDDEWSSLRIVDINSCSNLENITLGHLKTPNLACVTLDFIDFGATNDVNAVVQARFQLKESQKRGMDHRRMMNIGA